MLRRTYLSNRIARVKEEDELESLGRIDQPKNWDLHDENRYQHADAAKYKDNAQSETQ